MALGVTATPVPGGLCSWSLIVPSPAPVRLCHWAGSAMGRLSPCQGWPGPAIPVLRLPHCCPRCGFPRGRWGGAGAQAAAHRRLRLDDGHVPGSLSGELRRRGTGGGRRDGRSPPALPRGCGGDGRQRRDPTADPLPRRSPCPVPTAPACAPSSTSSTLAPSPPRPTWTPWSSSSSPTASACPGCRRSRVRPPHPPGTLLLDVTRQYGDDSGAGDRCSPGLSLTGCLCKSLAQPWGAARLPRRTSLAHPGADGASRSAPPQSNTRWTSCCAPSCSTWRSTSRSSSTWR